MMSRLVEVVLKKGGQTISIAKGNYASDLQAGTSRGNPGSGSALRQAIKGFTARGSGMGSSTSSGYSRTRTVAKGNYKSGFSQKSRMAASLDYLLGRPDRDGERQEREGFSSDETGLEREDLQAFLEETEGKYAYRLVLSPGQDFDKEELEIWAQRTMKTLEVSHEAEWVGVAHDKQNEHPHVHVIAYVDERLDREDFYDLRVSGDLEAERVFESRFDFQDTSMAQLMAELESEQGETRVQSKPEDTASGTGGGGGSFDVGESSKTETSRKTIEQEELDFD